MTFKTIVAALALAGLLPLAALAQGSSNGTAKASKADAEKVAATIRGDKAKIEVYCETDKLGAQMFEAEKNKDTKKLEALGKRMDALTKQLGPDYAKLMQAMDGMDPDSKQAQDIGEVLGGLDKLCGG